MFSLGFSESIARAADLILPFPYTFCDFFRCRRGGTFPEGKREVGGIKCAECKGFVGRLKDSGLRGGK